MLARLHQIDDPLRLNATYGTALSDYNDFYTEADNLMYNPAVQAAFGFTAADSQRYGSTAFGNACVVTKQLLAASQGTRFVQISFGSWDFHSDIYGTQNPKGNNMFTMGPQLDNGVGALLDDLKSSGMLDETLVVMVGEFGRTPGTLTPAGGRDHFVIQTAVFAGADSRGARPGHRYGQFVDEHRDKMGPGGSGCSLLHAQHVTHIHRADSGEHGLCDRQRQYLGR